MNVTGIGPRFYTLPGAPTRKIEENEGGIRLLALCKERLVSLETHHVHSTATIGFDMLVAWAAYELELPYTIYVPHVGWGQKWKASERAYLDKLLVGASRVEDLSKGRSSSQRLERADRHVVDRSDCVLALWDGSRRSRTHRNIFYAYSTLTHVENLWFEFARRSDISSL